MIKMIAAAASGLVFGLGLFLSGMTNPAKVTGFLDLFGRMDPSLAFVMIGAIGVGFCAFRFAARRPATMLGDPFRISADGNIDRPLVLGALIFGVGWGLAGYCPGPAVASLAAGRKEPLIFTAAMLCGMAIVGILERRSAANPS